MFKETGLQMGKYASTLYVGQGYTLWVLVRNTEQKHKCVILR